MESVPEQGQKQDQAKGQSPAGTVDSFLAPFAALEKKGLPGDPSWVFPIRKAGLARFSQLGMPTLRQEDWRFTNLAPLVQRPFLPTLEAAPASVTPKVVASFPLASLEAHRLVFVDGHFQADLSSIGSLPQGVQVVSLKDALAGNLDPAEKYLAQHPGSDDSALASLNDAYFTDGVFIHVPAGITVDKPVHLTFITSRQEEGVTAHPRNLIVAERESYLTVVEQHVGVVEAPYFNNVVTEIYVGDAAHVEHCKLQDESRQAYHIASTHAHLGRDARLWAHSIATGAQLSRHNLRTTLDGEGLSCVLNGLYLTQGEQVADHHMVVDHAKPNCESHEYFNGILADRSRGVFHGRILVRQEAQKTDAKQTNKNLLLSDDATANTKPQLEIYADDVKCTHGATIGQLNDESIFYLRARGIGPEVARRMLIHAFAGEIIERIQHREIREAMDTLVWDHLEEHEQIKMDTDRKTT